MAYRTRAELAQALTGRMARTYESLAERQELEPDTSLVKTYMLEAHVHDDADPDEAFRVLEAAFARPLGRAGTPEVSRTEDDSLGLIEARIGREAVALYIDHSNPRFWLAHSMSGSQALDYCVTHAVARDTSLDRAWLPAELLIESANLGSLRGLGLDYDRRQLADVDLEGDEAPVAFLKMQLWGNPAREVYDLLAEHFPNETTLSKVKVKYWLSGFRGEDAPFSVDDIKFDGKVTARGSSFDSHQALVTSVYRAYEEQIRRIERDYALRVSGSNGDSVFSGAPINFYFERGISNLRRFCKLMFSSAEPFRLWGTPTWMTGDYCRMEIVDLHIGCNLTAEISRDWMRLYVPEGTCGNSVLRIYTNLQHYYDSRVRVENENGETLLAFQPADAQSLDRSD